MIPTDSAPLLIASVALALSGASVAFSVASWVRRGSAPSPSSKDERAALLARVDALEESAARFVLEDGREMKPEEKKALAESVVETYRRIIMQTHPTLGTREAMREARRLHGLPP